MTAMNLDHNKVSQNGHLTFHEGPTECGQLSISRKNSSRVVPPIPLQKIK